MAAEDPSFNTDMEAISASDKLFKDTPGTPSTTTSGLFPAKIDPAPRICISGIEFISDKEDPEMLIPAINPLMPWMGLLTFPDKNRSDDT